MLDELLIAGAVICAVQAMRAAHLLSSALWLAGVSALVSVLLYRLGAHEVAVIELSVGAGLVTVLFVFAISIAGGDAMDARAIVPKPLALGLIALFLLVLGGMILPLDKLDQQIVEKSFDSVMWDDRGLDVLVQMVLIFTGVLCLITLLKDTPDSPHPQSEQAQIPEVVVSGNGHQPVEAAEIERKEMPV